MANKRLNILVTIPTSFCFGLQHISLSLFAESRDAIDPFFLITKWNNGDFEKLIQRYNFSYSFSWLGMFSRKLDWYNLKMSAEAFIRLPFLYRDFFKLIRIHKPDIIFFANHHELILLLPVLWMINNKVVCHMHDPAPNIPFQRFTFRFYGARVDKFIAVSRSVKDRLISLGCNESKISVVLNGIYLPDEAELGRVRLPDIWPSDAFIVGITGQMTETKGHMDLLEAFMLAYNKNPKLRLLIGGRKLEPLFAKLNQEVERLGLTHVIFFSDWVESVHDFYRSIDLLVLPSRHDEGYGLVVAEALAHGKPAIITESGGAVEIVEDGKSGFIVPKRDYVTISERIVLLSSNQSLYDKMSASGRAHVRQVLTMQKAAMEFKSILVDIA